MYSSGVVCTWISDCVTVKAGLIHVLFHGGCRRLTSPSPITSVDFTRCCQLMCYCAICLLPSRPIRWSLCRQCGGPVSGVTSQRPPRRPPGGPRGGTIWGAQADGRYFYIIIFFNSINVRLCQTRAIQTVTRSLIVLRVNGVIALFLHSALRHSLGCVCRLSCDYLLLLPFCK